MDQAYDLFCALLANSQAVDPDEFCARYPTIQNSLIRNIQAHLFLNENLELVEVGETVTWPQPGQEFAGFHLLRELGRGGFARVFQATEPALGNRLVVLKIARHGSRAEAATLGPIAHPNIVPVFSVTEEESVGLTAVCMPYLGQATLLTVLDHVYGRPVRQPKAATILEALGDQTDSGQTTGSSNRTPAYSGPPAPPRVLQDGSFVDGVRWLALQLVDALAFMHAMGICHRDLKPSNVLLRPDGTPMLLDFNLAASVDDPLRRLGGTPSYMAPEQLRVLDVSQLPEPIKPDARSDLYSLGVMLYELLTGKHPFGPFSAKIKGRDMPPLLLDRQRKGFPPIRESRPEVDHRLACVIEKCLAFQPHDRPGSAAEVARELRRSQGPRARAGRWLRRRRTSVAVACLLLLAAGFAGAYHLATRPPAEVVYMRLGTDASQKQEYKLAARYFTESLRANPNQHDAFFSRGKAYVKLAAAEPSHYGLASVDFSQAEQLALEKRLKGWSNAYLAYCLQKQGHHMDAIHFYQKALEQGFRTAEAYNNLAHLHLDRFQLKDAQENLNLAFHINPKLQVGHYNQAVLCYQKTLQATRLSPEQHDLLNQGIDHFRQVGEPMTGNMMLLGAAMCAHASLFDDGQAEPAIRYLAEAIKLGIEPSRWPNDPRFTMIKDQPGFRALLSQTPPPNHSSPAAICIVEPAKE